MGNSEPKTSDRSKAASAIEFVNPPINEVVCGVQLDGLEKWQTPHFGLLWQQVRESYPIFEDQQPLTVLSDPMAESETPRLGLGGPLVPLRRVWLIDAARQHMMQVDPPRFLLNWRKIKDSDSYPRFQATFAKFTESLDVLNAFINEHSLGEPRFSHYELSYINHILGHENFPRAAEKYLSFYTWSQRQHSLESPIALSISLRLPLPEKRGMVFISAKHGTRKSDNKQVLILELTARGTADQSGGDMRDWFDLAHATLLEGFVELTTAEAHQVWGRKA